MKILFSIIFIIFVVLGLRHLYFFSEQVDQGAAYGFDVGMSKDSASQIIRYLDCGEGCEVILSKTIGGNNVANVQRSPAENIQSLSHEEMNVWQIRYGGSEKNVLVLKFEDNKLKRMLRYRRLWIS